MRSPARSVRLHATALLAAALSLLTGTPEEGAPHLLFNYAYRDAHGGRYYLLCEYIGLKTKQRVVPDDGKCPVIRYFKDEPKGGSEDSADIGTGGAGDEP